MPEKFRRLLRVKATVRELPAERGTLGGVPCPAAVLVSGPCGFAAPSLSTRRRGQLDEGREGALDPRRERRALRELRQLFDEFAQMSAFHQSSGPFTERRVCTRATAWGRLTLTESKLVRTTLAGERTEEPLRDEAAWSQALLAHFGIAGREVNARKPR